MLQKFPSVLIKECNVDMNEYELNRLKEVNTFLQLDFDTISELKQITDLASKLCETPISLITLLDKDINWIKVSTGVEQKQAPRETSFCQFAIQQSEVLVIQDATKDSRFDTNPLVNDSPFLRFYAGAPLTLSNGFRIGTLCLFDVSPKMLTDLQFLTLEVLSKQVVCLLELKLTEKRLLQKNDEIEAKNASMRIIAQLQSHEIRHPLTSIMGLINLIKEDLHEVDEEWLQMITDATSILDYKIRSIVNETMGNKDHKIMQLNKAIEEIEDYAILLLDVNGNIENWNIGAQKIKGYASDEIVGKNFRNFYTPADRQNKLPEKLLAEAAANRVARNAGWRVKKDGSYFWASVIITSIHDDFGNVIGYIKVTRDLTDIREIQNSLDISEERSRRMIDEIEDYAIILLDENGIIERWNKGAERIKGYTAEEIIGKSFNVFYSEEDIQKGFPDLFLAQAKTNGRAYHEGWRVKKDKTKFWSSVVLTAIHNNHGEVIGYVKVTKDLKEKVNGEI